MSKNITVVAEDNVNLKDRHNMQPKKKVKMLHEQLFEQYQIDPTEIFKRTGILKTIPPEWIPEILIMNINSCKTPRTFQNVNKTDRVITVGFENMDYCKKFYGDSDTDDPGEFNKNMINSINGFLSARNESPKQYNRIIVTESSSDGLQVTIRY
ncbi:MAG: hypothetical protein WCZ11_00340 [Bacilli bacterium]